MSLSSMGGLLVSDLCIVASFFMARELEVACARVTHFRFDVMKAEVTWNMPVSKNDLQALGTHRTWGCICQASLALGCPYHAAMRQLDRLRPLAANGGIALEELPFFPNLEGKVVTKAMMVLTIEKIMEKAGLPIRDSAGRPLYGGHSWRTGGAVFLARLGLDAPRIEAMARWNSPMLLHYIRSAPIQSITKELLFLDRPSGARSTCSMPAVMASDTNAKIDKLLAVLVARIDKAEALSAIKDDRLAVLEEANAPRQFIRNCSSGYWHNTREHCAGRMSHTICGWLYTGHEVEVRTVLPEGLSRKMICGTCLPALKLLASSV